jgi:hypothetical protein
MRLSILISLFLIPLLTSAREEPDFYVYHAQSRSADELKASANSILNGGRVTTSGNDVIIYGTKSQRDGVLRLFSELDHVLRNFIVSFRVVNQGSSNRDAAAMQANVRGKNVSLQSNSGIPTGRGGGRVSVGGVSASAVSRTSSVNSDSSEQIVIMDGGTGKLYSGNPIFPQTVAVTVNSIGHSGARIVIHEQDPNQLGEQSIVTAVNVPFGEWSPVGGVTSSTETQSRGIVGSAKRSSISTNGVQVKIEPEKQQ